MKSYSKKGSNVTTKSGWNSFSDVSLTLSAGKYVLIGSFGITGANADAGVRFKSNTSGIGIDQEEFTYRGLNTYWRHPVRIIITVDFTKQFEVHLEYYVGNEETTLYNPEIIALPLDNKD